MQAKPHKLTSIFANYQVPDIVNTDLLIDIYDLTDKFGTCMFQNDQISKGVKRLCAKLPTGMPITTIIAASRDESTNYSLAVIIDDQFSGDGHSSHFEDQLGIHKLYIDNKVNSEIIRLYIKQVLKLAKSKGAVLEGILRLGGNYHLIKPMDLQTYKPSLTVDKYFIIKGACIPVIQQEHETQQQMHERANLTIASFDRPDELMLYDFGEQSPVGEGLGIIRKDDLQFISCRQKAAIEAMQQLGIKYEDLSTTDQDTLMKLKAIVEKKVADA